MIPAKPYLRIRLKGEAERKEFTMITEIGITAGDIWHYLDTHGKSSLSQIASGIDTEKERVLMSIGWLAREGHVIVEKSGADHTVYLRK